MSITRFESGGVWSRLYQGREEVFTVNANLPSDVPGHYPLAVTFTDGTNQIFVNPHTMQSMKRAKRLGFKCIDCSKIMFGAQSSGQCETCSQKGA